MKFREFRRDHYGISDAVNDEKIKKHNPVNPLILRILIQTKKHSLICLFTYSLIEQMLRNYLLIAYRNLLRHKVFSVINVTGLALGLTCSLLITLWVMDELRFNAFHRNADRMYQVIEHTRSDSGEIKTGQVTAGPLAGVIKEEVPEVEQVTRMTHQVQLLFGVGDRPLKETGYYVDRVNK